MSILTYVKYDRKHILFSSTHWIVNKIDLVKFYLVKFYLVILQMKKLN